jgi:chromate transporter
MMVMSLIDWLSLFFHFCVLSLLSVGGAISVMPDMHRYLVVEQGWLTQQQFSSSVAVAQIAPGPNVLFVALIGWNIGLNAASVFQAMLGAFLCLLGLVIPSSILTLIATRWAQRNHSHPGVRAFKAGFTPLIVALLASTAWLLLSPALDTDHAINSVILVLVATLTLWRTTIHLLLVLAMGAMIGGMGWV